MFKLFVNNVQIGNYASLREMMGSVALFEGLGANVSSAEWKGNSFKIKTFR